MEHLLPTVIIAAIIACLTLSIIIIGIRNHKRGKHSCACGTCHGCAMAGSCQGKQQ